MLVHKFLGICAVSCHRFNHTALPLLATVALLFSTPVFCSDLTETAKLTAPDGEGSDLFGESVSISSKHAIVGAVGGDSDLFDGTGAAYIFPLLGGGSWGTPTKVLAPDGVANDKFGTSVSIDGYYAIVGSPFDTNTALNSGSAYIFTYPFTDEPVKLVASDGAARDVFGFSVSVSGDYAIVGAPTVAGAGSGPGAAYIFERSESRWNEVQILRPDDGAEGDLFGYSVAISGNHAIVGAPRRDSASHIDAGAVYFFMRTAAGIWEPVNMMVDPDGDDSDQFGWSVSIDGDLAIAGAPMHDESVGADAGSALVLRYWNSFWFPSEELEATDGAAGDQFGFSVSLSNNYAVVGSLKYSTSTGAAYVFQETSHPADTALTDWQHTDRLVASDTSPWWFGTAVSLYGNMALVGAKGDDVNGYSSGSVYSYNIFAEPEPEPPSAGLPPGVILLLLGE